MQNNPRGSSSRWSQRFSRLIISTDKNSNTNSLTQNRIEIAANPWLKKNGASDKLELLSCIKFIGNRADKFYSNDDFTRFITIDNEGNIYYLRVIDDLSDYSQSNGSENFEPSMWQKLDKSLSYTGHVILFTIYYIFIYYLYCSTAWKFAISFEFSFKFKRILDKILSENSNIDLFSNS